MALLQALDSSVVPPGDHGEEEGAVPITKPTSCTQPHSPSLFDWQD